MKAVRKTLPRSGPDRDVVQVRRVGTEPSGARHRLVEGCVDASVGPDLGQQAHAVCGAQLLDLTVREQVIDDGMLAPQPLQGLGVGGVPGLGALRRREAQILEQHLAELFGRVDVDGPARVPQHRLAQGLRLFDQLVADPFEDGAVDADADVLHTSQHPHQRHFDLIVEIVQPLSGQGLT